MALIEELGCMSRVCVTESVTLGEDDKESFVFKGEKEGKKVLHKFERERKRPVCTSKNAVLARKNRLKKKNFVESLQREVAQLSDENFKLKQNLESQSSLVCSLRKEVYYLKGVLANSKEICMLLKSVPNTGLPVTSSLSKYCQHNQIHSTSDHNYVCTRRDSRTESSFSDLVNYDNAHFALDDEKEPVPIISDVPLSLSMLHDNVVNHPLLSPSDGNLCDTDFSGCYSIQHTSFVSPDAGYVADDELFMDAGVCFHVAKRRVSLEFCSICNSNALLALDDMDTVK